MQINIVMEYMDAGCLETVRPVHRIGFPITRFVRKDVFPEDPHCLLGLD